MNAFVRALETADQHRFTLDDVLRMQEAGILDADARVELIDGGLVEMAPEGVPHVRLKMQLARAFLTRAGDDIAVIVDSTLRLSEQDAPDPDLYLYDAAIPLEAVDGSNVGLVVEVAHTSLERDLGAKADLYAAHGVAEYWVVDLVGRRVSVHRRPMNGRYDEITHHAESDALAPMAFTALSIRLVDLPVLR